jgi:hypothetical protein
VRKRENKEIIPVSRHQKSFQWSRLDLQDNFLSVIEECSSCSFHDPRIQIKFDGTMQYFSKIGSKNKEIINHLR